MHAKQPLYHSHITELLIRFRYFELVYVLNNNSI
nr:MAG TPA: hypothetical protein [Caudoviricetes sp.]